MRIAATDSRGGRGPTGTLSAVVSLIAPHPGRPRPDGRSPAAGCRARSSQQPVSHGAPARFFRVIETVVLIDEADAALGEGEKLDVHRRGTLHRAFSVFAFNAAGELLLQRRAMSKYHSGGLWTNTCCGHPRPGETVTGAARRRLFEELGTTCGDFEPAGTYGYRAALEDLVENELDHLL